MCNGETEACGSICKLLLINMVKHRQVRTPANRYGTGKTKSSTVNRRGRSAANVIQGAKQREIIQVHENSPGRGKESPNDKRRDRSRQAINFRAGRDQTKRENCYFTVLRVMLF